MPFPDVSAWAPEEYLNQQQFTPDQAQAERDHQAQQLGLPTGLNEADYMTAFNQLMQSPEWAALQQSRRDQIAAESAATRQQYEESKDDRFKKFQIAAALGLGGAGLVAALGPGVAGAGAAGGGATGGAATTFPLATGGPITGSAIPGLAAPAAASAIPAAAAGGTALSALDKWLPYATTGVNTLLGAHAADSAADAEVAGLDRALAENSRQFDLTRSDSMPWITGGTEAINRLRDPAASFTASPGYEWARSEGQRDIGNSFAAAGGSMSGNAQRALTEFNTGLAQQDYGNWFQQQLGLAGMGANTTANVGSAGSASASRAGNYFSNQGASRASGVLGKYGALAGGLNEGVSNFLYRRRAA